MAEILWDAGALARLQETGTLAFGSRIVIHDLRRSWRSRAGRLGVGFEVAEKSLGHALPGIADVYAVDPTVERRTEAAALVAASLDRIRLGTAAIVISMAQSVSP